MRSRKPPIQNWTGLLALFTIASIVEAGFWNQMNVFTPLYLPQLGVRAPEDIRAWTGASVAITSLIGLPFLPLWGALADRYARQPVIVRSFVAHLLAGVVAMLAGNIWLFLAGRAIQSFALGNSGLMLTTLAERTPQHRVGFAFAVMSGGSPLGAFLGPLLGGPVVDAWGFPALLAIDSVIMLLIILAMTFGYRDSFVSTNRGSLLGMAGESLAIIWRSPRLRALFPALFMLFAGWMLAFSFITLAIEEVYKGPKEYLGTATGIVVGVGGLVTMVLSPLLGWLADRVGHWRTLFVGSGVLVLLWPLPLVTRDIVPFAILWAAINGLGSAVFAISFSVLSASAPQEVRGRVMSFAYLPVNVGAIVGAGVGSVITQVGVFTIFPVAAVLTALGVVSLVYAARKEIAPGGETTARLHESV
ncbi:MAG: MFS transporter [Chloroflexota bacterium]|nr:MFS transporter [Chloroflexota bacterium]MDQ5864937.1 MFS transporter [Chloroflexota bacterium]